MEWGGQGALAPGGKAQKWSRAGTKAARVSPRPGGSREGAAGGGLHVAASPAGTLKGSYLAGARWELTAGTTWPLQGALDGLQVCEETPAAKRQGKSFLGSPAGARVPRGTGGGGTFGEVSSPPRQSGAWLFPWRVTRAGRWVCVFFFGRARRGGTVARLPLWPRSHRSVGGGTHGRGGAKQGAASTARGLGVPKNPLQPLFWPGCGGRRRARRSCSGARSSSWPRWRRCG